MCALFTDCLGVVLCREEVNKWLVMVNLVSCFFLVPLASLTKLTLPLSLIGVFLGMPLGVSIAVWVGFKSCPVTSLKIGNTLF